MELQFPKWHGNYKHNSHAMQFKHDECASDPKSTHGFKNKIWRKKPLIRIAFHIKISQISDTSPFLNESWIVVNHLQYLFVH